MNLVALNIQGDSLESELLDLIDLIDSYHVSSNFCAWLSDNQYKQNLVHEDYQPTKYLRMTQYMINDILVFTGKHEFYLNNLDPTFRKKISSPHVDVPAGYLESIGFHKNRIARIASESSYTVISRNYIKNDLIALSWEIYELYPILKIYNEKQSPLKYWMSKHREWPKYDQNMTSEIEYIEKIDFEQIIQLIHSFSISTEFFYWLAPNDIETRIISETTQNGIYERISAYYVDTLRIYDGVGRFYVDQISKTLKERISTKSEHVYDLLPEFSQIEKKPSRRF